MKTAYNKDRKCWGFKSHASRVRIYSRTLGAPVYTSVASRGSRQGRWSGQSPEPTAGKGRGPWKPCADPRAQPEREDRECGRSGSSVTAVSLETYGRVLFALNVKVYVCLAGFFGISSCLEVNLRSKGRLRGRSQEAHCTAVPLILGSASLVCSRGQQGASDSPDTSSEGQQ